VAEWTIRPAQTDVVVTLVATKKPLPEEQGLSSTKRYRLPPPGQVCSGGRSPILIRSEPPIEPDSDSLPMPGSVPNPVYEGMLGGGSAGRATGRPPVKVVEGFGAAGWAARAAGLAAVFFFAGRAALVRAFAVLRLAVVRLVVDFLPPAFFAVLRLAVARLAVDFLTPARFAVLRLAVDFFDDFFFAGISPPFGCAVQDRALWFTGMGTRCCYLRFIA